MTTEQHKQRHIELHKHLDELVADWISETESLPSKSTVLEFLQWSHQQTQNPSDKHGLYEKQIAYRHENRSQNRRKSV